MAKTGRLRSRPVAARHRRARTLLDFLQSFAARYGNDAMEGAVLLLRLERPIDGLISLAMALDEYHPGYASPWSHNVLVTEPYHGGTTKILDCTIRDNNGNVAWNDPLTDILSRPLDKQGDIYDGKVVDYDDPRTTQFGIKFIPGLSAEKRQAVVAAGWSLKRDRYYYDIPGLFRELSRLLLHIPIPPSPHLLFCSAFCAKAYKNGIKYEFKKRVLPEDITDDEIWYPDNGSSRFPPTVRPVTKLGPRAGSHRGLPRRRSRRRAK